MVPQILKLAKDENIVGLILRVNSGGGSAYASEQIWEALEQFKKAGKKYYVSMGDVAASGGYYISCGAERIYAQPTTLTGSIGIFGLIPCAKELLTDKLSLGFGTVQTNANGNFLSMSEPMTPSQRAKMQRMINRGYETFVGRCAKGRHMSVDSIKVIAEGRVWDGQEALRLHLVDDLKPLHSVIADMVADLELTNYSIAEYPNLNKKWWEEAISMSGTIKESIVRHQLGDAYGYYNAIERIKSIEPIQCRMETVVIK
jgi:protease-4